MAVASGRPFRTKLPSVTPCRKMVTAMDFDPLSLTCAGIGAAFLIGWPLMRTQANMLLPQFAVSAAFAAHCALEGLPTASALNLLGAPHLASLRLAAQFPGLKKVGIAVIPATLPICVASWTDWTSPLSTAGTLLIAYGRMQTATDALKRLILAGTAFWLAHDLAVRSPLVVVDLSSLVVGVWVLHFGALTETWCSAVRSRLPR
ncbi:MAG: YgjV family protein [Cypionkella sp.]|uniref:YgjV family protein n=1 Tax=Cypionkella sp. TaxID=2811411 RepID=UPI002ABA83F8|nr:YgjV family protein [Cypionkella sp.]MDZ4310719.1 YgjV family protein [Cypionkella sp.]